MRQYGWSPIWEAAFDRCGVAGLSGRVVAEHRDLFRIVTEAGEVEGTIGGRLRHSAGSRADLPAVGDWVVVPAYQPLDRVRIVAVLPRQSQFARKGPSGGEQIVAANVDVVWIVSALTQDLNPRRLERYVTLGWESGARPAIVLTKADLVGDASLRVAAVRAVAVDVPVHVVNALQADTLEELQGYLEPGDTVALLGSSGVGKSTLVNTLAGREILATGLVRSGGKGRHTTTHRQLVLLPRGGLLLDTPGMRELGLWDADQGLERAFADIEELARRCRFRDCEHCTEPGCTVTAAIASGTLDPERLFSYRKLAAELHYHRARIDPAAARQRSRTARRAARIATRAFRSRLDEKYRR